jgi:hypothetical protein
MRKVCAILLALLIIVPSLSAQAFKIPILGAGPPGPWDSGMLTGFLIEAVGYGLFIASGTVISMDFTTGLVLYGIGSVAMPVGGLVWNTFLDQRHAAAKKKKLRVPEAERALSWTLTYVAAGCAAGAVVVPMLINDTLWSGLSGVILGGVAAIIETWATLGPRTTWTQKLDATFAGKKISQVEAQPVFGVIRDPGSNVPRILVGLNVSI